MDSLHFDHLLKDPSSLSSYQSRYPVLSRLLQSHPCKDGYKVMGFFQNLRKKYHWEGLILEVDETKVRKMNIPLEIPSLFHSITVADGILFYFGIQLESSLLG